MSDAINKAAAAVNVGTGAIVSDLASSGDMENLTTNPLTQNGGVLLPEQSRQFLDYVFDQMVLGNDGRRQIMRANTAEFDKIQVGTRLIRKAPPDRAPSPVRPLGLAKSASPIPR